MWIELLFPNLIPMLVQLIPVSNKFPGPPFTNMVKLTPTWISNYIHYKLWDEINYPFLNFNDCTVGV